MSKDVITISPVAHLHDARCIMNAEKIHTLPVVNKDKKLVGIITFQHLLRVDISAEQLFARDNADLLKKIKVEEIMEKDVVTIQADAPLGKAARSLSENKLSALVVLDDKEEVSGIITPYDIHRALVEELPALGKPAPVFRYMTFDPVTINKDDSLLEAHRLMGWMRFRSLPVMDDKKDLVGIITRSNVMSADPSFLFNRGKQEVSYKVQLQSIEKLMTKRPQTIKEDIPVIEAARLMVEKKFHSLPVVDESEKLIGIITDTDLMRIAVYKFF